jgi:dGTPase
MDWADDIAYAVHDVEDFYRAGMIPLDRLAASYSNELDWFLESELNRTDELRLYDKQRVTKQFQSLLDIAPFDVPYEGSREGRARLRSFTSALVDRYINATTLRVEPTADEPVLHIDPELQIEVLLLKGLTWQYVIESPALITQRYGQRKLIESLFLTLCEAGGPVQDRRVFPAFYQQLLGPTPDDPLIVRTVTDLIASLTEAQVVALHHRLTGISMGASLDPILP